MTLRKASTGVVTSYGGTYNIGFNDGDETQFEALNLKELEKLWRGFCKDENIRQNCIDYVERVN